MKQLQSAWTHQNIQKQNTTKDSILLKDKTHGIGKRKLNHNSLIL